MQRNRTFRALQTKVLAVLFLVLLSPAFAFAGPGVLYLTFDDGPIRGTSEVLEVLKESNAKATFFLVGSNQNAAGGAAKQKELLNAIIKAEHKIGNHTYSHQPKNEEDYVKAYDKLSTPQQLANFRKNYDDNLVHFRTLLGTGNSLKFKIARLPGDGGVEPALKHLRDETEKAPLSMKHYGWRFEFAPNGKFKWVPSNDWQGIAGVAASVPTLPPSGTIVLFHDEHWAGDAKKSLRQILQFLIAKQYTFQLLDD